MRWLLITLIGCTDPLIPDDTSALPVHPFPGHWSGNIQENILNIIDIDTTLHFQLYLEVGEIKGFIYHTDGDFVVLDQYQLPCWPQRLQGEYIIWNSQEIYAHCLHDIDENICIQLSLNEERVIGKVTYPNIGDTLSIDFTLNNFEYIDQFTTDDRFKCIY